MFHPSITRPKLLMLAVAAALASAAPRAEGLLEETVMADMDWQPMKAIPLAEQDLACRQCGGRFLDPLAKVDLSQSPTEADLEVYADDTEVTEGELLFQGNVSLKQGYRQVTADQVTAERAQEKDRRGESAPEKDRKGGREIGGVHFEMME